MIDNKIYNHNNKNNYVIKNNEFWYLLNLYETLPIIGIENPYVGQLIEEIKSSEENAIRSLLAQNILFLSKNNSLEIRNSPFKSIIETCLNTDHCLWLIVSHGKQNKVVSQRFIYFSSGQIVDLIKDEEQNYQLTVVSDSNSLDEILGEFFQGSSYKKSAGTDFVLELSIFDGAVNAFGIGDAQASRQLLSSTGLQEQSIDELESALGDEGRQLIAIDIRNPTNPEKCYMNGYGYLTGQRGGWVIQEYEQGGSKFIHFESGTVQEFQKRVFSMIGS